VIGDDLDKMVEGLEEAEVAMLVEGKITELEELDLGRVSTAVAEIPSTAVASTKIPFTPAVTGSTIARVAVS
jgi:hypothetical protein